MPAKASKCPNCLPDTRLIFLLNVVTFAKAQHPSPTLHRRLHCLTLMLAAILWRFAPLHLPFFLFKYGGSVLWAVALYWFIAAALPRVRPRPLALIAAVAAALVEFSRLVHTPASDTFRLTLAGQLLLGRFFSLQNIAAYWLAIALTASLDARRTHSR